MTKLAEVRTQIYLPREQHRELRRLALVRETSMAQVVREALDEYLSHEGGSRRLSEEAYEADPIWRIPERAVDFGRDDAAGDHDAILYGPPDRASEP
jgi:hypothetical protein